MGINMPNVIDYIEWRGDLTFKESPFNEVDNIILSQIAYVDLSEVVPDVESRLSVTLEKACDTFFQYHDEEELKEVKSFIWQAPFLMRKAASCARFREVKLSRYSYIVDEDIQTQFAAFTADLGDGTVYVAYMGTDDTLVGWKEDFNMSFLSPVPAQTMALDYLNAIGRFIRKKIRVGGHSKGGNLAIYSGMYAGNAVRKKIIQIYNNDGPGFDKGIINSPEYIRIKPVLTSIVPYRSLVGMLLEHDNDYMVVSSSEKGVMQHDAMSWQVKGAAFVKERGLSQSSRTMNETLSNWINSIDRIEREEFVDTLFEIISASGATTLSEIQSDRHAWAGASLKLYAGLPKKEKTMMRKVLLSLTNEFDKAVRKQKNN